MKYDGMELKGEGTGILDSVDAIIGNGGKKKKPKSYKQRYLEKKRELEEKIEDKEYKRKLDDLEGVEAEIEDNPVRKVELKFKRAFRLPNGGD